MSSLAAQMLYKRQLMIDVNDKCYAHHQNWSYKPEMVIKLLLSTYYVLLDKNRLQIRKIAFVKLKELLIRKEITELYRICYRQRFQIAAKTLCRQLQSAHISHSI